MSEQLAKTFIEALRALEQSGDVEPLAGLYAEKAQVGNLIAPDKFTGPDGARTFWTEYRGTFTQVESEFRNVIAAQGRVALEWTTQGTGINGQSLSYTGVTILESENEKLMRSCAYFDPSRLGRQIV